MQQIRRESGHRSNVEDLFFEHYGNLHKWAMQLTRGNRWEADDLVQELYVELARTGKDTEQIRRPEDYLFSVLRNIQYARLRRAGRSAIDDLSIVDFDSIEGGLQAVDRSRLLFIHADLHSICDFVCERKNSSRTASILILRFFLGYFPTEIMSITQSSRIAVDQALQVARREAKLTLERPGVLTNIESLKKRRTVVRGSENHPLGLFRELRGKIASSCTGDCFEPGALKLKYADVEHRFSVEELAHLVSCMSCLDEANAILGLPLLEERSPDDALGRDNPPGPNPGAGSAPGIAPRGARPLPISRDKCWVRAKRRAREIDEHRPQRLLIAVDGEVRASQKVTAELSELHAKLRRDERPTFIEVLSEQGIRMAFLLVAGPDVESGLDQKECLRLSDGRSLELTISFADETPVIWADYHDPLLAQDGETEPDRERLAASIAAPRNAQNFRSILHKGARWFLRKRKLLSRWKPATMPEINPFLASALLLGCASVICFLFWLHSGPRISVDMLLERAKSQHLALESTAQGVIFQKVRISTSGQSFERTIYRDPQGKRRVKKQSLGSGEEKIKSKLSTAGVSWDDPLSAANYKDWHDHREIVRDTVNRSGPHLLTLTTRPLQDPLVLQETLTVRDDNFHPVKRTIDLRNTGTIEIAELNYDVLPWAAVNDNWFEPLDGPSVREHRKLPPLQLHEPTPLSDMELDAAELNVRLALNELGADTDLRISFLRQASGLRVKGIVASEERKREIETRLASIPHVIPSIFTFSELQDDSGSSSQVASVRAISNAGGVSLLEDYLIHHNWQREDAQHLSEQLLDAAVTINQNGRAIAELLQEFGDGKTLLPASETTLSNLLARRKQRLLDAIAEQHQILLRLDFRSIASDGDHFDGDLAAVAGQNFGLCKALITGNGTSEMSPDQFLNKLDSSSRELEILAQRIPISPSSANSTSTASSQHTQPDNQR